MHDLSGRSCSKHLNRIRSLGASSTSASVASQPVRLGQWTLTKAHGQCISTKACCCCTAWHHCTVVVSLRHRHSYRRRCCRSPERSQLVRYPHSRGPQDGATPSCVIGPCEIGTWASQDSLKAASWTCNLLQEAALSIPHTLAMTDGHDRCCTGLLLTRRIA